MEDFYQEIVKQGQVGMSKDLLCSSHNFCCQFNAVILSAQWCEELVIAISCSLV